MKGVSAANSIAMLRGYESREQMVELTKIDPDMIDDEDESTWPEHKVVRTVTIEFRAVGGFNVREGDKYSDHLTFDEMLGTVASLSLPDHRPCLQWMLTKEQHEARRQRSRQIAKQNNTATLTP